MFNSLSPLQITNEPNLWVDMLTKMRNSSGRELPRSGFEDFERLLFRTLDNLFLLYFGNSVTYLRGQARSKRFKKINANSQFYQTQSPIITGSLKTAHLQKVNVCAIVSSRFKDAVPAALVVAYLLSLLPQVLKKKVSHPLCASLVQLALIGYWNGVSNRNRIRKPGSSYRVQDLGLRVHDGRA